MESPLTNRKIRGERPTIAFAGCRPPSRFTHFTDQELAIIKDALQRVGTAVGAQMCGEIAHEQAVRK